MNIKILESTTNPIELIYKSYRQCYSKDIAREIEIPTIETTIGNVPDNQKMIEFIKDKLDKGHESPLEHVAFTFSIEGVSRVTEIQLIRHRLSSFSIQSGRYCNKSNIPIIIPNTIVNHQEAFTQFIEVEEIINHTYNKLIEMGIPKEDARYIMPQGQATNIVCTMNLRQLRHFLSERLCIYAQWEIRELANLMYKEVELLVPFVGYNLDHCDECVNCLVKNIDKEVKEVINK